MLTVSLFEQKRWIACTSTGSQLSTYIEVFVCRRRNLFAGFRHFLSEKQSVLVALSSCNKRDTSPDMHHTHSMHSFLRTVHSCSRSIQWVFLPR